MALFEFLLFGKQFDRVVKLGERFVTAIEEHTKAVKENTLATTEGFEKVAKAISDLQTPELPPDEDDDEVVKGVIKTMGRYKFTEDQDPVEYDIEVSGFQTRRGTAGGGQDIDTVIQSSSQNLQASFVSGPTLSEDGSKISARVRLEGNPAGMQNAELAAVTISATNRDTNNQIAADIDEFETGPGEVTIGTINTPVPLPEVGGGETGGGAQPV